MTDFTLDFPADKEIKILQLTDMQTIDLTATRNPTRDMQIKETYFKNGEYEMEARTYREVRAVVEQTRPDLIVLTGDNVYGEFDDKGTMQKELVELMESFGIPWAVTFGNHDNESDMGLRWQQQTFYNAPNCLYTPGTVTGNANYSIMLTREGTPAWVLYLLDTNGCHPVGNPWAPEEGIHENNVDYNLLEGEECLRPDQIKWFIDTAETVNKNVGHIVPSLGFFHIAIHAFYTAFSEKYGYSGEVPFAPASYADGDWGEIHEKFKDTLDADDEFFHAALRLGMRGMFVGHQHKNDASVLWKGMRLTFGVKSGRATYWRPGVTGGTLITLGKEMKAEPIYMKQN